MYTHKSPLFSSCSMLMAFIFLYSASVQLNDPGIYHLTPSHTSTLFLRYPGRYLPSSPPSSLFSDWYFWFPLYSTAFSVNFLATSRASKAICQVAQLALWGGVLLLLKVVVEAHLYGLPGILSLDMGERAVREKIGSGLVVISMLLHSKAYEVSREPKKAKRTLLSAGHVKFGMATLVALSYGLFAYFLASVKEEDAKI